MVRGFTAGQLRICPNAELWVHIDLTILKQGANEIIYSPAGSRGGESAETAELLSKCLELIM
jgi:hypothetical protein